MEQKCKRGTFCAGFWRFCNQHKISKLATFEKRGTFFMCNEMLKNELHI